MHICVTRPQRHRLTPASIGITEVSMLIQAAERQQQLIQQQQQQAWYPDEQANPNTRSPQQRPVPLRGSNESLYYHPTTTRQPPHPDPNQPHVRTRSSDPGIHRPSTAPPQQLRSVLSPPQAPERYRVRSIPGHSSVHLSAARCKSLPARPGHFRWLTC